MGQPYDGPESTDNGVSRSRRGGDSPTTTSAVWIVAGKVRRVSGVAAHMPGSIDRPRRHQSRLMPLDVALDALGHDGNMGRRRDDVPVDAIVGTSARQADFDAEFRLVNPALRDRWQRVASAFDTYPAAMPPVQLVQLGELYFVADGHHRVSVARGRGQLVVSAQVQRIYTVAYAMSCIRAQHLTTKAAERSFLERVPLADDVREDLWLDRPADWSRLADTAEAWGLRRSLVRGDRLDRHGLAATWWHEEVVPVLHHLRAKGVGLALRDVQLYVAALGVRDHLGLPHWPDDLADRLTRGRGHLSPLAR